MSAVVPEIPGFFFDPTKRRYFKIEKNTPLLHQYTETTIKANEDEAKKVTTRARLEKHAALSECRLPYPPHLSLSRRTYQPSPGQVLYDLSQHRLSGLKIKSSIKHSLPTTITKVRSIQGGKKLIASDVTNVYRIDRSDHDTEPYPHLLWNRANRSTSLLRGLEVIDDAVIARTWFGSLDEPSEVEFLCLNDTGEVVTRHAITDPRDSFNASQYNTSSRSVTVCAKNSVRTIPLERTDSSKQHTGHGDALSINHKDTNVTALGFRSGEVKLWDQRERYRHSKKKPVAGFRSIVSVLFTNPDHLVCSSFGSKIQMFDVRNGFDQCLSDFRSTKKLVNVFGESLSKVDDDGSFMLQTKDLVEVFHSKKGSPAKIITNHDRAGRHIVGATWDTWSAELITLSQNSIEFYD